MSTNKIIPNNFVDLSDEHFDKSFHIAYGGPVVMYFYDKIIIPPVHDVLLKAKQNYASTDVMFALCNMSTLSPLKAVNLTKDVNRYDKLIHCLLVFYKGVAVTKYNGSLTDSTSVNIFINRILKIELPQINYTDKLKTPQPSLYNSFNPQFNIAQKPAHSSITNFNNFNHLNQGRTENIPRIDIPHEDFFDGPGMSEGLVQKEKIWIKDLEAKYK